MTSASIAKASATKNQTGAWVVDYTTTTRGSTLWDKVAQENFHEVLSIDFDGRVVSAPIIQPTQSSFTSFNGEGEISGNLTKAEALALAKALPRT
jgi:preprotein translocase subunit SecD